MEKENNQKVLNFNNFFIRVTLLKNDDTLLEFRRSWRFLTGAGVLGHVFDVFI